MGGTNGAPASAAPCSLLYLLPHSPTFPHTSAPRFPPHFRRSCSTCCTSSAPSPARRAPCPRFAPPSPSPPTPALTSLPSASIVLPSPIWSTSCWPRGRPQAVCRLRRTRARRRGSTRRASGQGGRCSGCRCSRCERAAPAVRAAFSCTHCTYVINLSGAFLLQVGGGHPPHSLHSRCPPLLSPPPIPLTSSHQTLTPPLSLLRPGVLCAHHLSAAEPGYSPFLLPSQCHPHYMSHMNDMM